MQRASSPTLPFNPNLHGLRGAAALSVLFFHWGSKLGHFREVRRAGIVSAFGAQWDFGMLLDFGFLGVSLFFILSGYLLTRQLISRDLTPAIATRFWQRRALRIYPAFWLQLTTLLILAQFLDFMPQMNSVGDLIRHVSLWLYLPPWATAPMNAVWWTLPVELSFYLMVPFLVLLASRVGSLAVVLGSLAVTLVWRFGVMEAYRGENYFSHLWVLDSIPGSLFVFCIGIGLAYALAGRPMWSPRFRYGLLAVAGLILYVLLDWQRSTPTYWTGHWMLAVWSPMAAVVIGVIMFALVEPLPGFKWLGSRPMVRLGDLSFGIYLWHYPLLILLNEWIPGEQQTPAVAIAALVPLMGGTLALAAISYYALEKPIMERRARTLA